MNTNIFFKLVHMASFCFLGTSKAMSHMSCFESN